MNNRAKTVNPEIGNTVVTTGWAFGIRGTVEHRDCAAQAITSPRVSDTLWGENVCRTYGKKNRKNHGIKSLWDNRSNYTSISSKDWLLSRTQQVVTKAGRASEMAYQVAKNAKALKRDVEGMALDNNASVAGNDTTARETGGLVAWLKTNISSSTTNSVDPVWTSSATGARSDGVQRAFTETLLQAVQKKCFDSGGEPSMLLVGSFNKQAASAFAGIAAQRFMAPSGPSTIIGAAEVYVGDFGELSIIADRFQRARDALLVDPSRARLRVLDTYKLHEMAKSQDGDSRLLTYEWGLQVDNEAAHGIVADLNVS